ncbi:MAG: PhoX family protein [Nocardioidaceae bacterium]
MSIERRTLLKTGAAGALLGGPFAGFAASPAHARSAPQAGTLVPIKDKRDGKVRLHLPKGFSYRSFHDTESPVVLDDGTRLPGRHDGMGAFRGPDDSVILVRNHEVNNPVGAFGPGTPYDASAGGGTTTVHVTKQGEVLSAYTSLNGTMMNCSGGVMPWGSWITCEETVNGPDVGPDFTGAPNTSLQKPHGYVFEVPANGESDRQPVTRAGRFAHEAVSFDPVGGSLYLTEDNFAFASGFYRYTPAQNPMVSGSLDNDGVLEMLAVKGEPNKHLEGAQQQGATYHVEWVVIDEPDFLFDYTPGQQAPTSNDEAIVFVGDQGRSKGAAYFSRLEGQVYDDGVVYFTSTQAGGEPEAGTHDPAGYGNGFGQVWGYDTRNQKLTCIYQSPDQDTLDFPDNVTASPRGTIVLCEDSAGDNYLRGLSTDGRLWDIALNRLTSSTGAERYSDEFAGSTFSTDGHALFVNIQASKGITFAIWGPWRSIGV